MRPVALLPISPAASDAQKLEWCVRAITEIARASQDADPNRYADAFSLTNVTSVRTFNADSTTLAEVADVLGTFISDHKQRGSKRT